MADPAPGTPDPPHNAAISWLWESPYVLLVLTVLFWSGNFIVGRAITGTVPPITLAFWRWAGALCLVLIVARPYLRRDIPILLKHWPVVLALAVFGVASFNTLVYIGLHSTTAINALLLQSVIPIAIMLCSLAIFGEKIRRHQLMGIAVSFLGVDVIATRGLPLDVLHLTLNPGDAWVLAAVLSYALYSVLLRKRPQVHPFSFLAATFAIGVVLLLPLYLWEHASGARMEIGTEAFLAMVYVAVFPGFLSYLFFNRGVDLVGANRAGQFIHLMPAFGSIMAIVFLGEDLHLFQIVGIVLIAFGLSLASSRPFRMEDWFANFGGPRR
jgi:drug/metabolite transporter (DMT)-like permease